MAWKKMTKSSVLKRQQAETMFAEGFGPHKVSKSLEVNFHTVRDWQTAFIAKRECRNQGNTLINRTLAMNLFSCGYGYRTVSRVLRLPAFGSVVIGPGSIASFQSCKQGKIRGAKNNGQEDSSTSLLS